MRRLIDRSQSEADGLQLVCEWVLIPANTEAAVALVCLRDHCIGIMLRAMQIFLKLKDLIFIISFVNRSISHLLLSLTLLIHYRQLIVSNVF